MDDINYQNQEMCFSGYVSTVEHVVPAKPVKSQAYQAMDQLEGWCSKQKASVLIDLVLLTKPQTVVEIGVFGGKSVVPVAYALKENGLGKIYGIDPWLNTESIVGMDGVNKEWWLQVDHEKILLDLMSKIYQFDLQDQIQLIRATSENALPISNIDILHIDGNHSDKTSYFDVMKWVPLVRKGGIIIFDDVTWGTTDRAVNWLDENCAKLVEYKGDNVWAIWIKS